MTFANENRNSAPDGNAPAVQMQPTGPEPPQIWRLLLGDEHIESAVTLEMLCTLVRDLDEAAIERGLSVIAREESIGCFLNPTAYLNPRAFRNLSTLRAILGAVRKLKDEVLKA